MKLSRNIKQQNIRPKLLQAQETPQSQDLRYVHPSMDIPHLTLHIQECNLDKDIIINSPSIQIHPSLAQIHDHEGNFQIIILLERL